LYNIYNLLFTTLAINTHNSIAIRHPVTTISCGPFVPLAVKWPLDTRRVSRITVKALVTSNIIQSVCLVGKGRLKERCGLELRTDFFLFSFKKSAKTSGDWIQEYTVYSEKMENEFGNSGDLLTMTKCQFTVK